jgi:hypothetical protein
MAGGATVMIFGQNSGPSNRHCPAELGLYAFTQLQLAAGHFHRGHKLPIR